VGKSKTETLKADNYEYPFDIVLEGSLPESVEGLPDSFVVYRFKAEIGRKYAKDIVVRKPLRIIRTMSSNALELAHAMVRTSVIHIDFAGLTKRQTVSNVWPNKIEYAISTPSKAIIYGTSVQAEFRLVSLLKGLKIGNVTTQVVETQEFSLNPDAVSSYLNNHKSTRVVADDEYIVPEDPEILDEEAEGYKFSRHIELPKSLTKCMQDAETRGIKIRHKLKFNILLHNPDDHTSELRATLPVSLYISPSLAINENNELVDQSPVAARRAIENDIAHHAPPLYGDHQLDQIYSDVDFGGYHTPANFSTPGTPFRNHSRNISSENISSLDINGAGGSVTVINGMSAGDVPAAALRSRLQNLRSGSIPPATETLHNIHDITPEDLRTSSNENGAKEGGYFSSENSSRRSRSRSSANQSRSVTPGRDHSSMGSGASLSRRTSDEDYSQVSSGAQTPGPQFLEVEHLSRVPSYSTAVRASARTPYSGPDLPSYGAATSGNASLSPSPHAGPGSTEPPPTAHIRGQVAGAAISLRSGSTFNARELNLPARVGRLGNVHGRTVGEIQDEERRLRLMQARGRA
jgi:arrestin-related trafficking adapter 4/5/7